MHRRKLIVLIAMAVFAAQLQCAAACAADLCGGPLPPCHHPHSPCPHRASAAALVAVQAPQVWAVATPMAVAAAAIQPVIGDAAQRAEMVRAALSPPGFHLPASIVLRI